MKGIRIKSKLGIILATFSMAFFAPNLQAQQSESMEENTATITLAGGCFWCVEAVYDKIKGVTATTSGYMGGHVEDPTYKAVCAGTTGHAEVVQITYNPDEVNLEDLLEVFWYTHDPTTLNRQGNDVGTQYRSAIYYHSTEQKRIAERSIAKMNEKGLYPNPIMTEVTEASTFYVAEDYHQDYYAKNPGQPYCAVTIPPKLRKLENLDIELTEE